MNIKILLLLCCLATTLHVFASKDKIYPTPQSLIQTGKTITLNTPVFVNGMTEADSTAVQQLCQLFNTGKQKKNYTIHIGERGDKAVKKYVRQIPEVNGGYYLSIQPEQMIIAGHDERGTFYAIQTLKQLLNGNTLPEVEIKDFPAVAYRGVVEGFTDNPGATKTASGNSNSTEKTNSTHTSTVPKTTPTTAPPTGESLIRKKKPAKSANW